MLLSNVATKFIARVPLLIKESRVGQGSVAAKEDGVYARSAMLEFEYASARALAVAPAPFTSKIVTTSFGLESIQGLDLT